MAELLEEQEQRRTTQAGGEGRRLQQVYSTVHKLGCLARQVSHGCCRYTARCTSWAAWSVMDAAGWVARCTSWAAWSVMDCCRLGCTIGCTAADQLRACGVSHRRAVHAGSGTSGVGPVLPEHRPADPLSRMKEHPPAAQVLCPSPGHAGAAADAQAGRGGGDNTENGVTEQQSAALLDVQPLLRALRAEAAMLHC